VLTCFAIEVVFWLVWNNNFKPQGYARYYYFGLYWV